MITTITLLYFSVAGNAEAYVCTTGVVLKTYERIGYTLGSGETIYQILQETDAYLLIAHASWRIEEELDGPVFRYVAVDKETLDFGGGYDFGYLYNTEEKNFNHIHFLPLSLLA